VSQAPLQNLLATPPTQTAVVGKDGMMTAAWVMWFQKLLTRVGGPVADNLTEVSNSVAVVQAETDALNTDVVGLQATTTAQGAQIVTVQGTVAGQGADISGIQAILAPGISVTVTTAALTLVGAPGSMTFLNGILTAQVQAT
jgi:hypothetical protein